MEGLQARFERVALPHLDAVYRMARRLTGKQSEAEDLVQETYLKAFRAFDRFELRKYGAKPWLLKILHNTFYTRAGRASREPALIDETGLEECAAELDGAPVEELAADDVNWDLFDQELKDAIEDLAPELQEVLLLWGLEELSYKEIADVCGCPLGTVMSRLYRARQQASRRLADYARERRLENERSEP